MAIKNSAPTPRRLDDEDSLGDWIILHKNALSWGVLALAIAVGGIWFYRRSQVLREQHADTAYYQARREAAAGNLQLARSDFKKMADRYSGTRAGTEARIYLAEMLYDQRMFKEGIAELKTAESSTGSKDDFASSVHVLEANGYEELQDFAHAAEQYHVAADMARFPMDKNQYKAYEARALMGAGKRAEALAVWQDLAKDPTSPFATEAKLRIGEIVAQPART